MHSSLARRACTWFPASQCTTEAPPCAPEMAGSGHLGRSRCSTSRCRTISAAAGEGVGAVRAGPQLSWSPSSVLKPQLSWRSVQPEPGKRHGPWGCGRCARSLLPRGGSGSTLGLTIWELRAGAWGAAVWGAVAGRYGPGSPALWGPHLPSPLQLLCEPPLPSWGL